MGAADSVPGVSGGTVALILGHYHRLVSAISHFDRHSLALTMSRQWRELAQHIDLRFLIALGAGVAIAIGSLVHLMHWLLENRLPETLAVFMGLILASIWIVAKQVRHWTPQAIASAIVGAIIGYVVCSLSPMAVEPGYGYLFFCGLIAITAMILPGISGAFVLVVLGVYHHVTGLVKDLLRFNVTFEGLLQVIVFASGCAIGLAAFSRILRWLLDHYQNLTFACLLGLMIGSLKRVWPLQQPTPQTAGEKFSHRVFEFVSISDWTDSKLPLIALCVAAFLIVLALDYMALRMHRSSNVAQPGDDAIAVE